MIYLIFAILFSASLALALRISETFSDNRYGILVGNYVTCLVVAFVLLPDKNIFAAGSRTAVLTGIVNGFLFTGNLVLMQKCIRENGAVLSSAFAKLGIVIPVTASILFLGEIPTLFQLVGIVLVIVAIWVINSEGDRGCGRRRRMGSAGLLLVLFVVSGMADGMSKVTERIGERRFDALFLFYTFLTALVLTDNSGIFRAAENPPQDWKDGLFEWCGSRISKLFFNFAAAGECVETAGVYRVSEL